MFDKLGIKLGEPRKEKKVTLCEDGKAIIINGEVMEKSLAEKPISGEDHNVCIYFREGEGT